MRTENSRGLFVAGLCVVTAVLWSPFTGIDFAAVYLLSAGPLFVSLSRLESGRRITSWIATTVLFGVVVPAGYAVARFDRLQARLSESLAQGQLARAQSLAAELRALAPIADWRGKPVQQIADELDRRVADMQSQVATPLGDRLERARLLAMLGRVEEAHDTLRPLLRQDPPPPAACLLLATALESREEWTLSRDWYRRAQQILEEHDARSSPLWLQATKGIAFTSRKLGRYRDAESAYLSALQIAPTADLHFLLAQFYEDGQQTTLAFQHAQAAMRLAPKRYESAGRQLIDKLRTQHFGCWSMPVEGATR